MGLLLPLCDRLGTTAELSTQGEALEPSCRHRQATSHLLKVVSGVAFFGILCLAIFILIGLIICCYCIAQVICGSFSITLVIREFFSLIHFCHIGSMPIC